LIVGIGRAGAYCRDKAAARVDKIAAPPLPVIERDNLAPLLLRVAKDGQGVHAHDAAPDIAVAIAGARAAFRDVTHHRAGIAADLFADLLGAGLMDFETLGDFAHEDASA